MGCQISSANQADDYYLNVLAIDSQETSIGTLDGIWKYSKPAGK
jgi:hypothetical protein